MNTIIIIAMIYAACLLLVQTSYWGITLMLKAVDFFNKNKQLLFVVTIGLALTLFFFH